MSDHAGVKVYYDDVRVFSQVGDDGGAAHWNIDFQGDRNHNNTYGQTDPVDYSEWGVYWNIFEVPALSAPWPGPTNYATNPSMDLADDEGSFGVGKLFLVKFSIIGDAYGWAGDAGDDPLTGDYLIILNGFGVTNDPLTWRITGLARSTTYRLTYYHRANVLGRGINFVANGVKTMVGVPGLSVASALVTTDWLGRITGTANSDGYSEGDWSALTIGTVAATVAGNPHPADGATGVPINVVLSWKPGDYAVSHDVYFGTSSPPAFIGNLAASSYDPGPLEPGITYYWQVNEVEADGTKHTGDLWSFTTGVKPDDPKYPDITAGLAWSPTSLASPTSTALIWTPTKVFHQTDLLPTAEEVKAAGSSISNVQGIVWSPTSPASPTSTALIWTPTKVFHQTDLLPTAQEVTGAGSSISNVRGIVWSPTSLASPTSTALIWTPTKVFHQTDLLPTAEEVTGAGSSISNAQGIVWSPTSPASPTSTALIWTLTKVFQQTTLLPTVEEVTAAGSSISNVRGIVWSPTSLASPTSTALIWTPTRVFQQTDLLPTAEEVTGAGSSISNVQGIVWSPTSPASPTSTALIWTPTKVF
ncbi:MAG: hypothetical protein ACYTAO_12125, partial [Planctomycetota bacterium]